MLNPTTLSFPVAIDSYGAALLGKDWQRIGHIADVDGELGQAAPIAEIETTNKI
ncbi:hypothetical protein H206_02363 [Candidatus Electrothrix aarhusensis]|jgi:hypothetical protein|uniref:Uncharacterized protein n=1 Tax=Candidatus Electrothrix aarhusensis TaxID=1859131 RepID=A0A444ISJ6_9BACT|nr:hypothetical protein H206_02363 [Candidatus Electrothrix aarhusensis]